jgi:hypothetical protein
VLACDGNKQITVPDVMKSASRTLAGCIESIEDASCPIPVSFGITEELMQKVVDFCVKHKNTLMLPESDDSIDRVKSADDYAELVRLINAANMLDIPLLLDAAINQLGAFIANTGPFECAELLGLQEADVTPERLKNSAGELMFLANPDSWWAFPRRDSHT